MVGVGVDKAAIPAALAQEPWCHMMPEVNMVVAYRLESSSIGLWAHDIGTVWQRARL